MRFSIIPQAKLWFSLSAALVLASLFFIFSPSFGLTPGIDFTGGTKMNLVFDDPITKDEFGDVFSRAVGTEKSEEIFTSIDEETGKDVIIFRSKELSSDESVALKDLLVAEGKTFDGDLSREETVGPTQGSVQRTNAYIAVVIAIVAILVFVALAFRQVPHGLPSWKLGVATVVALAHDVIIVTGLFALLGKFYGVEVDTLFITALLTVLGWSVNDTIVVFDRLRENLKGASVSKLGEIAEKSVWQTMARSIHTSVSTLIVLGAILFAQIDGIHFFVLALTAGIIVGTYSSIFLATPLLVAWAKK